MTMNGGMYKNAFSCAIPGTEELGCEMAAALGALGGDWTLGLECLKHITPEHVARAKELEIPIEICVAETKDSIFIEAEVTTENGVGVARIEDFHSNIVYAAKDKEILFRKEKTAERHIVGCANPLFSYFLPMSRAYTLKMHTLKGSDTSAAGQTAPLPPISRPHIAAILLVKAHPRYVVSFPIAPAAQGQDRLCQFQYGPQ